VSADNKVYTIKLRPNLTFSDGSPLTAEDVAFTLTVLLDPKYDGDTDITLANIAGGAEYKAGKADSVSGLKVIDPLTLQVTTTQPGATTLARIGGPVLSKAYYGKGISAATSTISAPCTENRWATVLTSMTNIFRARRFVSTPTATSTAAHRRRRALSTASPTRRPTSSCSRPAKPTTTPLPRARTISNS
jgi:ABC-type transport system substrate-binding protein